MPNYLFAYHGGGMPETEEARAEIMGHWMKWFEGLGAAVVDGGNPIGQTKTMAGSGAVSDGGGANPIAGYSIITADSMDAAVRIAKTCPMIQGVPNDGSIEICETFNAM